MDKKYRTNSATLSTQIKRAIGYRILLCFLLAMTVFLLISFNDVISGSRQLEKSLEEQCTNLESFVISQAIIKNEDSIKPKFDALNQASNNIKITWETGKTAVLEKKLHWIFPFSWIYVHKEKIIDQNENKNIPEYITNLVLSVVSEKRVQNKNKQISFDVKIKETAYGIFANVSASSLKRVLSNLLDNAIESIDIKNSGLICVMTPRFFGARSYAVERDLLIRHGVYNMPLR